MPEKKSKKGRLALMVLALAGLGALGGLGWHWAQTLTVRQIDVSGTRHAARETLLELARVDTGLVLYDLDPRLLEDRLQRHAWVQSADVTRLPTGTLSIRVVERTPVALAVDATGNPVRSLDRSGFAMPLDPGAVYDVPLLRGARIEPAKPAGPPGVRALLDALAVVVAGTNALLSEFVLRPDGEVWVYTAPAGPRGAIPVRLGRGGFGPKLARLKAFWHQAVLTRPERRFTMVDLRFDNQVVTREEDSRPN